MSDLVVLCAFLAFAVFLLAGNRSAAIAGWGFVLLNLWSELPAFLAERNFLYPALALLSLPFFAFTAGEILRGNGVILRLSRAAAFATIIWVPFALVPVLRDALVAAVVTLSFALITALGHHPQLLSWDVMAENGFSNQIIPGCTGIAAIAMMLGLVLSGGMIPARPALRSFLLIVPVIFLLNLVRVAVVFIAVSDRWFSSFPDPTGTGDPNFFWAHNVIAEALAIVFLLWLVRELGRTLPGTRAFLVAVPGIYLSRLRDACTPHRDGL